MMIFTKITSSVTYLLLYLLLIEPVYAQQTGLSIKEMLQKVQVNLPQLEVYRQQAGAAGQNILLAKNSLVPDLTAGYQLNMATFNNITGMSYPGFLLPISGPPSIGNDLNFVPGSALGTLVKWTPLTFGQRKAAIEKATAKFKLASATYNEQLFEYQYRAINSYLEAIYLKQIIKALQASINRNKANLEQSLILAINGLKPGIDTIQFQSAITQSEIDELQAGKSYSQSAIELTRLSGIESGASSIVLTDTVFQHQLFLVDDTASVVGSHPLYQAAESQRQTTAAALKEIQKSWAPQLDFWGNMYARGSGVEASGNIHQSDGFNLSRTNMGLGFQLSFPLLQFSKTNIQKKQYGLLLKSDEARTQQVKLDITKQIETAIMQYQEDVKIADKTPQLLQSANEVYQGLKISYENGLIDYARLAQSQYDLVKAELADANANLQLWRSLLAIAIAKGNLDIFLTHVK
jgi:outer membrane protein